MPQLSDDSAAAILANELKNIMLRIEALPAHPKYTEASMLAEQAADALTQGRTALHQINLQATYGAAVVHASDCALHNEPAMPKRYCDCTPQPA